MMFKKKFITNFFFNIAVIRELNVRDGHLSISGVRRDHSRPFASPFHICFADVSNLRCEKLTSRKIEFVIKKSCVPISDTFCTDLFYSYRISLASRPLKIMRTLDHFCEADTRVMPPLDSIVSAT